MRSCYLQMVDFSLVWWRQSIKISQASKSSLRQNSILHILNNSSLPKLISWNSITNIMVIRSGYFGTCLDIVESLWVVLATLQKEVTEAHLASFILWRCRWKITSMMQKANCQQRKILAHVPWPLRLWIMYFCCLRLPTLRQIKWHITY